MSHTDLGQPDLAALCAAAGNAVFAEVEARLPDNFGYRLGDPDPLTPLACAVACSLTEAGLILHHCATYDPLYRIGGVCLPAVPPETGEGHHQAMNAALGGILTAFGYQVAPFGSGGAWLVTGRRTRGTGAGQ